MPPNACTSALVFQRDSGSPMVKELRLHETDHPFKRCYGCFGTIKLLSGYYAILLTSRELVCELEGTPVYTIGQFELLRFANELVEVSNEEAAIELEAKAKLEWVLSRPGFYFSYERDLTHTMQHAWTQPAAAQPLWQGANDRFWYNRSMQGSLIEAGADGWILPIIRGFVGRTELLPAASPEDSAGEDPASASAQQAVSLVLISRRSQERAGVRYWGRQYRRLNADSRHVNNPDSRHFNAESCRFNDESCHFNAVKVPKQRMRRTGPRR